MERNKEKNKEKKKRNPVKVLVTIVLVLVGIFAGLFVFHRVKHSLDMKFLAKKGYYNPVSIGDYSLNVVKFGYEEGRGKIVVLSGMGAGMAVDLRTMARNMEDDYQFIYIGRPGWDGSDDVHDDRNVDVIVEEYRKALKASGVETPVILMAHSMGGTYASYWANKYPEEVEAFVNIDGTYVEPMTEEEMVESPPDNTLYKLAIEFGIFDIMVPLFYENELNLPKDEWRAYCILQLLSISSDAVAAESAAINRNRNATWESLQESNVPKLYISARDADLQDPESRYANEHELIPYLEKMGGDYTIDYCPGSHFIYRTNPGRCEASIRCFLELYEKKAMYE